MSHIAGGNGGSSILASRYTIEGNSTASEATANRALNSLSAKAATVEGGRTVLINGQHNDADVRATTKAVLNVAGSGADSSAISINGNTASSLARGNAAENSMTVSGGADNGGGVPQMLALASFAPVSSGAVLTNRQVNDGGVTAKTVTGAAVSLNCGCATDSRIGVTGNTGTASAYGNAALNSATAEGTGQPFVLVSNVQDNRGPVSASVTGQFGTTMTGGVNASAVAITGNSLAATAIGNQAVNTLTVSR